MKKQLQNIDIGLKERESIHTDLSHSELFTGTSGEYSRGLSFMEVNYMKKHQELAF